MSRLGLAAGDSNNAYDYIIVGAGSAGCVLAHRLSHEGRIGVLLIEGGGTDLEQPKIAKSVLWATNIGSDTDWGNTTVPQPNLANRVIPMPVAKILGGGSSINATLWLRGDKSDYDAWEAAGGPDWGFAAMARAFKKVERYAGGEGPYRGGSGLISTRKPALDHPVTHAFNESSRALGIVDNADLNGGPSPLGTGQLDVNTDVDGRRVSVAHAYLLPALSRKNLTLLPSSTVIRLDIRGGQCQGVVALVQGKARRFTVRKDVILCAGALHSPKLLMLSGIGPADHLRKIGITVAVDAPGVGANLHDHVRVLLHFAAKQTMPPLVDTGHSGATYVRSRSAAPGPDVQLFGFQHALFAATIRPEDGYNIFASIVKPRSRGTVRLTSADPFAPLAVDPNYLAERADVDAFVTAVELGLAIGNGKGFEDVRKEQLNLLGAGRSQIVEYVRSTAFTYFHYAGTCAMGTAHSAPVDAMLRVRGVSRLRVVDASVIPELPCSNTNAPTLSLAEKAAELILSGRG